VDAQGNAVPGDDDGRRRPEPPRLRRHLVRPQDEVIWAEADELFDDRLAAPASRAGRAGSRPVAAR
jgi:hypothetical protein